MDPAPPSDIFGHGEGTRASQFVSPRLSRGGSEAAPLNGELPWPLVRSIPLALRAMRWFAGIQEAPNKLPTNALTPRRRPTSASFFPKTPSPRDTVIPARNSLPLRSRAVTIGACKDAGTVMDTPLKLYQLRGPRTSRAAHSDQVRRLIQGGNVPNSAISNTTAIRRFVAASPRIPTEQFVGRQPQRDWRIA